MQKLVSLFLGPSKLKLINQLDSMSEAVTQWTWEENKVFEMQWEYLTKGEWEKVAVLLPTKSIDDIKLHYKHLLEDVELIHSGLIPLPDYSDQNQQEEQVLDTQGNALEGEESSKS